MRSVLQFLPIFSLLWSIFIAAPLSSTVLFEDSFDSLRSEWTAYLTGRWIVEGGYLKYYPDGGIPQRYWVRGDDAIEDYEVEARACFPNGDGATERGMSAILGRMNAPTGGYALQYDFGVSGLRFTRCCTSSDARPIMTYALDNDWHNLKIAFAGDSILYYIDDIMVESVVDGVCLGGGFGLNATRVETWFDWFRVTTKDQVTEHRPPTIVGLEPASVAWTSCNPPMPRWWIWDSSGINWTALQVRIGSTTVTYPDSRLTVVSSETLRVTCPSLASGESSVVCILHAEDFYGNSWGGTSCQTMRVDRTAPVLASPVPSPYSEFLPSLDSVILTFLDHSGLDTTGAIFRVGGVRCQTNWSASAPRRIKLLPADTTGFPIGDVDVSYSGLRDRATGCDANIAAPYTFPLLAAPPLLDGQNYHLSHGNWSTFTVHAHHAYLEGDCRLILQDPASHIDTVTTSRVAVLSETTFATVAYLPTAGRYRYAFALTDEAGRYVRIPDDTLLIGPLSLSVEKDDIPAAINCPRIMISRGSGGEVEIPCALQGPYSMVDLEGRSTPLPAGVTSGQQSLILRVKDIPTGLVALMGHDNSGRRIVGAWLLTVE